MHHLNRILLALGAAAGALTFAAQASAGTAKAGVSGEAPIPGPSVTQTNAGFATAEASFKNGFAQANAYEFKAGIGASAFAAATGSLSRTTAASASASMFDRFRVTDSEFLENVSDTIFLLNFTIRADGTAESNSTPFGGGFQSQVASQYDYSWNVNGVTGSGHHQHDKLLRGRNIDEDFDSFKGGTLLVSVGDLVNISFTASVLAGAFSLPGAGGDAATDFSHTLAWNGVTGISAMSKSTGAAIDLPTGFRLSLMSEDGTFDYWNAAGPNPFLTPVGGGAVPEPASWALVILGFGAAGAALRGRRAALAA